MKLYYRPKKEDLSLYERALNEASRLKDRRICKILIGALLFILCSANVMAAGNNPVEQLGNEGISLIQLALTFIAIFMALFETGKAMIEGDPKRIPSIVAKYGIGVVMIYAIPKGFFYIRDVFDRWGY